MRHTFAVRPGRRRRSQSACGPLTGFWWASSRRAGRGRRWMACTRSTRLR